MYITLLMILYSKRGGISSIYDSCIRYCYDRHSTAEHTPSCCRIVEAVPQALLYYRLIGGRVYGSKHIGRYEHSNLCTVAT